MNLLKTFYYQACSALPSGFFKKISSATTFFPYHHIVSDDEVLHIQYLYKYKNTSQFKNDLDYLLKNFKPISVQDLVDSIKIKSTIPPNSFLLTFDDGYSEVYNVVAPILKAKGVPAIFFINPAFVDNKEFFYRCKISLLIHQLLKDKANQKVSEFYAQQLNLEITSNEKIINKLKLIKQTNSEVLDNIANGTNFSFDEYLKQQKPFLTTEQIHSLNDQGFTIGAHSWNHPYYNSISHKEQIKETLSSCNYVKENFHPKQITFSFPHSDALLPQKLFDELRNTDIDLLFGIQNQKEELKNKMIHRFNAERPEITLDKQMKGMMLYMSLQKILKKNQVIRNKI